MQNKLTQPVLTSVK